MMQQWIQWLDLHPWFWPAFIIAARITDVSIGTVRTIMVIRGLRWTAAFLGFFEVLIWITAVSGVLVDITVVKVVAYGLGFAMGNATGIWIDEMLAFGQQLVVTISQGKAHDVAFALRMHDYTVTELPAVGQAGDVAMALIVAPRRKVRQVIRLAEKADAEVFITVHDVKSIHRLQRDLLPGPTGWRSVMKRK
ncbi:DUF2179 domain-containing protein [Planctomycetales bacterium ZRK34]|nr:DUF2179 domain-containing protein [Planctomycetales bacterium ZRK34]